MPRLIMLSGPSASGKTTYRARLLETMPGAVVLSADDILEEWRLKHDMTYQEAFAAFYKETGPEIYARLEAATAAGQDIIWDQTNLSEQNRREALEAIPDDYDRLAVAFEAPLGLILDRSAERERETGRHMPEDVIRVQHAGYMRPHYDEGFDHIVIMHQPEGRAEVIA